VAQVAFLSDPWGVATFIRARKLSSVKLHFYLTRGELQQADIRLRKAVLVCVLLHFYLTRGELQLCHINFLAFSKPCQVAFLSDPWGVATTFPMRHPIHRLAWLHFYLTRGELQPFTFAIFAISFAYCCIFI